MKKSISRLQLTYIFSYMLIFLVPFSIMSSIFYYNSVTSLREEIELTNLHNLEIIRKLTDGHIRELGKIGALISNDAKLTQYMVSKQNFWPDAIAELKKYKENSSIISDIYLYYFNQKEVFSADGMMSVDTFLEYRSSLDVSDKDLFIREISTSIHPFISTNLTIFEDNPTYLYPLPAGPVQSYGAVLMKLDEYFFADMIKNILGSFEGNIFIFDQNNELIEMYTTNKDSTIDFKQIKKILNTQSSISEIEIDHVKYSISKVVSETNNWSFITVLPTKQFFSKVSEFKTFIIMVMIFIAIVTSFITIYIAIRQSNPINRLIELGSRKDKAFQYSSKNPLDHLHMAIENMYAKHEDLNNRFIKQEPLIRDQYLIMLLQGQIKTMAHTKELYTSINLDFNDSYSFVIITSLSKELLSEINMAEIETSSNNLFKDAKTYSVELINDKLMAFIVNSKMQNQLDKSKFINLFLNSLGDKASLILGVGETYYGKEQINRSFIEANAAYHYGKENELDGIIPFKDIKERRETSWLPSEHLLKLTQSYKQANAEIANESIKSLIKWLKEKKFPLHLARFMQYDIANTVIKTINEIGVAFDIERVYIFLDIHSLDKFEENLINFTNKICIEISKNKEKQQNQLQFELRAYIKNHYMDYDFSLENMAIHFNLSASYLSRFIKEETEKTFSQFVWELRLEEVKRQLVESNIAIKNIISSVGYIDASNFTRKFRMSVGMTPSQYRDLYTK